MTYSCCKNEDIFAELDRVYAYGDSDALEDYLNTPPIPSIKDPIKYWYSLDSSRNPLARMALDILSAPGQHSIANLYTY